MSTTAPAQPLAAFAGAAAPLVVDIDRPILICGVGRSGTSLLQSMLNAHPAIAIPPETHFFRRYVVAKKTRAVIESDGIAALLQWLRDDSAFARTGVSVEDVVFGESDGAIDTERVYRKMLEQCARRAGKSRVGDKDPRNLDFLGKLATTFSQASVLHIIRDPRAVVHSRMNAAWSADRPWRSHAFIAQEQLRRGRRAGKRLFGPRYFEVRYEELLADPVLTLARVCEHIGVPFDTAMLNFSASAQTLVSSEEMAWKKETLGPLLTDNDTKWHEGLTAEQVAFIETVCVEAFDKVGYERVGPKCTALHALGHRFARSGARIAYSLRLMKETRG